MATSRGRTFWSSDWFSGLLYTIAFVAMAYGLARANFYALETSVYDRALGFKNLTAGDEVAVVHGHSLSSVSSWSWSSWSWSSWSSWSWS